MYSYIDFAPGPETWEEHRAWQGCPTVARTAGGRLFAGWYTGGLLEPCIDNFNVLVRSDDNGETWSHPILAVYSDRENRNRNIDIQLWVDPRNRLWVMWTRSPYPENAPAATIRTPFVCNYHKEFTGVELLLCCDPDAETLVWEDPRVICGGFLRCKPIVTTSGRYIFPAYDWVHPDRYYLRFSDDEGQTFYDVPASEKAGTRAFDETMVYETLDGSMLRYLVRTNCGFAGCSESFDGGKTWTATHPYMKYPSTRLYIGRLSSGMLAMVRNIAETERTGMKVCLSDDEGETWKWELTLDTRPEISYPDLCEGDGYIYIVHDRERCNRSKLNTETWTSEAAKEILLSRVTEEDIRRGTLGDGSFVSRVISKGLIGTVDK